MPVQPTTPARERILNTAKELFYEQGIRAVGIDTIIERSGVAKMTLYRHFPSKDDLIVAYLEELDRCHWAWFDAAIARHPGQPRRQLLDVFDALIDKLSVPEYRGCAFSNVVTEFPDASHPSRRVAHANAEKTRARLAALAREADAPNPEALGNQLALLLDGAYVMGQRLEARFAAILARDMAGILLEKQLPTSAADR